MKNIFCLLLCVFALTSCEHFPTTHNAQQTYVVASVPTYPPFIIREENGATNGFSYELLQAIAKQQNISLQFIPQSWHTLFPSLSHGQIDIISPVFATEERRLRFEVGAQYLETTTAILVRTDSPIQEFKDLKNKNISVHQSSLGDKLVNGTFGRNPKNHITQQPTLWLAVQDVFTHKAEAAVGDYAAMSYYLHQHQDKNFRLISDIGTPKSHYVYMVRKGNKTLLHKLNQGLMAIRANGTYDKLYHKYFP